MILILHIAIALISLGYTTYLFFKPSKTKLYVSYGLIVGTVASGTYLVITLHSHILQACLTGLFYIAIALSGTLAAQRRLSKQSI